MKKKLELNLYDINDIKTAAVRYWTEAKITDEEPNVKAHIQAFFDFLNNYGYLADDVDGLAFTKDRIIRKRKGSE